MCNLPLKTEYRDSLNNKSNKFCTEKRKDVFASFNKSWRIFCNKKKKTVLFSVMNVLRFEVIVDYLECGGSK